MYFQRLPRLTVVIVTSFIITLALIPSVTAYWKTEFLPCKDSKTHIGVAVSYLYCDMYKFTRAGYKCNETSCIAPAAQCIKDGVGGKDPVEQAKTYLRSTGACQDLDRAKFDTIKKSLELEDEETGGVEEIYKDEEVEYIFVQRERHGYQRCLFAVQEHCR